MTYCLGAYAPREPRIALAAAISVAAPLALPAPLHRISRDVLSDAELSDVLLFGVAAVVVLPLLPDRTIDPFGVVNPFTLWRLVVVLMAMSGAGYFAQRARRRRRRTRVPPVDALAFAALVTVIGLASSLARTWLGAAGTIATASIAISAR